MGFGGGQLYKFLHFETVNLLQRNKNARTIANKRAFLARTGCLLHPLKRWICPKSQDLGHFFGRYHQAHIFIGDAARLPSHRT